MRVRRRRFERQPQRRRRLSRPVISVGNLSMGGTGKSPVVAAIAQWLIDAGERPAILSRGYARRDPVDGVVVVSDGTGVQSTIDRSGDEPLMLARQVPRAIVCVSPERYLSGRLAEQLGATVHILDDGFQHLELARDLDILVTSVGEIPNGKVIPNGRLREPIDAAARAQVLVVSDATEGAAASEAWALGVSQACAAVRTLGAPIAINGDHGSGIRDQRVLAVAGIAHPERFVASLRDAAWNVTDALTFADHHRYSAGDLATIASRMKSSGADVVFTTDKDAVRFEVLAPSFALYRVPLAIAFDPAEALFGSITAVLRGAAASSIERLRVK
jgi:tetraacyldisaccharide 4'-kinase